MDENGADAAPQGSRYVDQRPYVVADSLDELDGPVTGTVLLDSRLDWSGHAQYDLDNHRRLASLYETVLREASSQDDLTRWLNATLLVELWAGLVLPPHLRRAWETRFPALASARSRAA